MGIADAIVDLVSSGTTLRENNLKEIEDGVLLESQVSYSFSSLRIVQYKYHPYYHCVHTFFIVYSSNYHLTCIFWQGVLIANKKSLIHRKGLLDITHEILERLEAHLRAAGQFTVILELFASSLIPCHLGERFHDNFVTLLCEVRSLQT